MKQSPRYNERSIIGERVSRWLVASFSLVFVGCMGAEEEAFVEDVDSVEQAYSEAKCSSAAADVTLSTTGTLIDINRITPLGYNNPQNWKSYIWDIKKTDFGVASAFPSVQLEPETSLGTGGLRPWHFDTKGECEGLFLKRRIYLNGELIAESSENAVWDVDFGCQLPYENGPYIAWPEYEQFGHNDVIRVCATARDINANVVRMRLRVSAFPLLPPHFQDPKIKAGTLWYPVVGNQLSADAYCIRRGHTSKATGTLGVCTRAYIEWDTLRHDWRVPALSSWSPCQNVWSLLSCNE